MLPGNLQYWQPCKFLLHSNGIEYNGTIINNIHEPIHFTGPSPGDQSAIAEEEKKDKVKTSEPEQLQVTNQDDPRGAAQQSPSEETNLITPVLRPIEEEKKEPEPSQTSKPAGGAAMNATSVDAAPRVNQYPISTV